MQIQLHNAKILFKVKCYTKLLSPLLYFRSCHALIQMLQIQMFKAKLCRFKCLKLKHQDFGVLSQTMQIQVLELKYR